MKLFSHPAFDVVAIGDTTEDVFLEMSDVTLQCDKDNDNCKLCLDFAEKIAVDKKTDVPAVGNAANNAIGIARLGLRSAIYTVVGDDIQGHLALDVFRDEKVDTRYIDLDRKRGTNYSVVINYKTERTILVYHEPRSYKLPHLAKTGWIYLTSCSGGGVKDLHAQVLEYLEENPDVKLSFNPGTHQLKLGIDELRPLLQRTDMLFLNREETANLLQCDNDDVYRLIHDCHGLGVKTMVLTDGPAGAYASDGKETKYLKIFEGPVVERTGSGDSFGAGFLAAIIKGKTIAEAMLWGNANSTSVVQYIGAREGLLEEDGVRRMIEANKSIAPVPYC